MRHKKRIMVCVTQQKSCQRLIDAGHEMRRTEHDELHVVHVYKENWKYFGQLKEVDAMEYLFDVAKSFGAELSVLRSTDIEETLKTYMIKHKITAVIMGESLEPTLQQNMIHRLQSKGVDNVKWVIVPLDDIQ